MHVFRTLFLSFIMLLVLYACDNSNGPSGPSYTGENLPASIDSDNVESIGAQAAETLQKATSQNDKINSDVIANNTMIHSILIDIASAINTTEIDLNTNDLFVSYAEMTSAYLCGGAVSIDNTFSNNSKLSGDMILHDLCISHFDSNDITLNGKVIFAESATSITLQYSGLSITDHASTELINLSLNCNITDFTHCTLSSNHPNSDQQIYRLENIDITESESGFHTAHAQFFHPQHGSLNINATDIRYGCANGLANAGTIIYDSGNTSGSITFRSDCTGYDGTWNSTKTSGAYSSNWP